MLTTSVSVLELIQGRLIRKWRLYGRDLIFTARSDGSLTLNFQWLTEPESAKTWRKEFGQVLLQHGFSLPADYAERYVRLLDAEWLSRLDEFLGIVSALIDSSNAGASHR